MKLMDIWPRPLVEWTDKGLYCSAGDFYIDPHRVVNTAVVTHAHSDHARRGSKKYICAKSSVGLMKVRLGQNICVQGIEYGEQFDLGKVTVSLHPAGHILGSAQVRIEFENEVWVVSGDYKRDPDPSCEPFEPVTCDVFITEATFGTPKFIWKKNSSHGKDIFAWWMKNAANSENSILFGYSLGKAQRILAELFLHAQKPILVHKSIIELTHCYETEGRKLAPILDLETELKKRKIEGELILAPPSILRTDWSLGAYQTAFASGWMQGQSHVHGRAYDHGFVMSDHADWNDLNQTIDESRAKQVFVLHRGSGALIHHLKKRGIRAYSVTELIPNNFANSVEHNFSLFNKNQGSVSKRT